jgi:hypothetical protein
MKISHTLHEERTEDLFKKNLEMLIKTFQINEDDVTEQFDTDFGMSLDYLLEHFVIDIENQSNERMIRYYLDENLASTLSKDGFTVISGPE